MLDVGRLQNQYHRAICSLKCLGILVSMLALIIYTYRLSLFITCLLEKLAGFNIVMIVVDSVFKRVHFIFTYTIVTTEGIIRLFLYYIWKPHSLFNYILGLRDHSLLCSSLRSYIIYLVLKQCYLQFSTFKLMNGQSE